MPCVCAALVDLWTHTKACGRAYVAFLGQVTIWYGGYNLLSDYCFARACNPYVGQLDTPLAESTHDANVWKTICEILVGMYLWSATDSWFMGLTLSTGDELPHGDEDEDGDGDEEEKEEEKEEEDPSGRGRWELKLDLYVRSIGCCWAMIIHNLGWWQLLDTMLVHGWYFCSYVPSGCEIGWCSMEHCDTRSCTRDFSCCVPSHRGNQSATACLAAEHANTAYYRVNTTCTPPQAGWAQVGAPFSCLDRNWFYIGVGALLSVDLIVVPLFFSGADEVEGNDKTACDDGGETGMASRAEIARRHEQRARQYSYRHGPMAVPQVHTARQQAAKTMVRAEAQICARQRASVLDVAAAPGTSSSGPVLHAEQMSNS